MKDAKESFKIDTFIYLPDELQQSWSSIDPFSPSLKVDAQRFKTFLAQHATSHDIVLIQGDFGLTYIIVNFCKQKGIKAIYATTARKVETEKNDQGEIKKITKFKHVQFREYGV